MSKQEAFIFTTSPYMDKLTVITSITTSDLPCHNVAGPNIEQSSTTSHAICLMK
jgi:hypothetical protein